ncbi:S1/P1 nuclease [Alteromonas ponticola]|uniref:S1/P1 nuclease n=1 Tax=Alteromonas ponticola TaxID=2720613 RepID=A0ABX1R0D3_9ALTE|nr:S1/P1 nuclease [Alteromonas ponticola]NMH59929.1 S1/P1 nuclease [Alteromonas ponticola]
MTKLVQGVLIASFTSVCLFTSTLAAAWGQTGHRVTGAIAEHYLSAEAKAAITALLPNESLAEASTWADEMRSNPDEFWQKTASPWHYVTVPGDKNYPQAGAPKQGDAYTALNNFKTILQSPDSSRAEKQRALRFIVHIIGDLHQPLHAGDGTDRGGNDVKVRFFWEDSNLHRVWDSQLIQQRELSYSEWTQWLSAKISADERKQWHDTNPQTWIAESVALRKGVYPEDANNMNYDYLYQHMPTVKKRLQQAGVRIADYLNEIYQQ